MTVAEQVPVGAQTGNGSSTAFAFSYPVFDAADLVVSVNGLVQTLGVHYTVTGVGGTSGTIVFTTAPASGAAIVHFRQSALERETNYLELGDLQAAVVNRDFDRIWLTLQELQNQLDGTLRLARPSAVPTMPAPEASQLLGWNAAATGLANYNLTDVFTGVIYADWAAESFTGDGAKTSFVLARSPGAIGNIDTAVGGVTQTALADYSLAGNVLTFTDAPANGATVFVRYGSAAVLTRQGFMQELKIAAAPQSVFTLTVPFTPGAGDLAVYVDGLRVTDYVETSATTVTFTSPLPAGAEVLFVVGQQVNESISAAAVGYVPPGGVARTQASKNTERLSVLDFGAAGDGLTDDTAAIQLALDALAPGVVLDWAGRSYRITAPLMIPFRNAWTLNGGRATIRQHTDNAPIFVLTHPGGVNDLCRDFKITDFIFDWLNPQTAAMPKSIAIAFDFLGPSRGAGFFQFVVNEITCTRGSRTISIHPDTVTRNENAIVWGFEISNIYSRAQGAAVWLNSPGGAGGSPRCNFRNIYITGSNVGTDHAEIKFYVSLQSAVIIENLEFNVIANHRCGLVESSQNVLIDNLRFEIIDCDSTANGSALFTVSGSTTTATVRGLEFQTVDIDVASFVSGVRATGGALLTVKDGVSARDITAASGYLRMLEAEGNSWVSYDGPLLNPDSPLAYLWTSKALSAASCKHVEAFDFYYNNASASLAATLMNAQGELKDYRLTRAGYVVGVIATTDKTVTAGSMTVRPRKSDVVISGQGLVVSSGRGASRGVCPWQSLEAALNHKFDANNLLSVTVETSADFAPANTDIHVRVLVFYI